MPNRDNSGPNGDGPKTGRKMGNCEPEQKNERGLGKGRGLGRGRGRGQQ